jgi:hypothetical protein
MAYDGALWLQSKRKRLLQLKPLLRETKYLLALCRFARKYRLDQSRDDGGRWVDEGGGSRSATFESILGWQDV